VPNQPRPGTRAHNIRLDDDLWAAAQAEAEARGETVAEAVRKFLQRYTKNRMRH
jgi:antitoxin component of RelBE/YafQ-DinJ toxin-antitoxin module